MFLSGVGRARSLGVGKLWDPQSTAVLPHTPQSSFTQKRHSLEPNDPSRPGLTWAAITAEPLRGLVVVASEEFVRACPAVPHYWTHAPVRS